MATSFNKALLNNPNFLLAVSAGMYPWASVIDKFGENPDVDTGTPEDVWEAGGDIPYDTPGTAPIEYLSSSSVNDTGQTMTVLGQDIDGNEIEQEAVTDGQNVVTLGTPLWRVYSMENQSSQDLEGTLYCHTDPTPTAGVPLPATIRSIIDNGNNRTLNAFYTIPKGKIGFLLIGELGTSRAQTTGAAACAYYSRRAGRGFTIKKRVDVTNSGTSYFRDKRVVPDIIPQFTDIKLRAESVSANNMGIVGAFQILLIDDDQFDPNFVAAVQPPTTGG